MNTLVSGSIVRLNPKSRLAKNKQQASKVNHSQGFPLSIKQAIEQSCRNPTNENYILPRAYLEPTAFLLWPKCTWTTLLSLGSHTLLHLHSLHLLCRRSCSHMLLPPHSLHWLRCRLCSHMLIPPHSLHWLRSRLCSHMLLPPHSLH